MRYVLRWGVLCLLVAGTSLHVEFSAAEEGGATPPAANSELKTDTAPPPPPIFERVATAEKGTLKNPYTDNPEASEEGRKIYFGASCNGCHGGTGGGGMCPPLSNEVWVYGSDDDTLFRLVTLGTVELQKRGYTRKGRENVVSIMPSMGPILKTEEKLWKVIAWIRSVYRGDPARRNW